MGLVARHIYLYRAAVQLKLRAAHCAMQDGNLLAMGGRQGCSGAPPRKRGNPGQTCARASRASSATPIHESLVQHGALVFWWVHWCALTLLCLCRCVVCVVPFWLKAECRSRALLFVACSCAARRGRRVRHHRCWLVAIAVGRIVFVFVRMSALGRRVRQVAGASGVLVVSLPGFARLWPRFLLLVVMALLSVGGCVATNH